MILLNYPQVINTCKY